jgi:hypothetical protein
MYPTLIGLGIPEDEARQYNNYVDDGNFLVLVDSNVDRVAHVYDTFRTHNSLNASTHDRNETNNNYIR